MADTGWGIGVASSGAGTTLTVLQEICKYHGWHDTTTTGLEALRRFINRTLQLLAAIAPWPEYHKIDGLITLIDATDGYICTVDGPTNISDIASVGSVVSSVRMQPLLEFHGGLDEWIYEKRTNGNTGQPLYYALRKYVAGGVVLMKMNVYPCPTAAEADDILYFPYWIKPAELTEGSDVVDWPDYRLWLLEEALEMRIASKNRDTAGKSLESPEFMAHVHLAMSDSKVSYLPTRTTGGRPTKGRTLRETIPYTGYDKFGDAL